MNTLLCPSLQELAQRSSPREIEDQRRIFEKDEHLQRLFIAIPSLLMILNHHRQLITCNPSLLKLLGKDSIDSLAGLRPGEFLRCIRAQNETGGCGTAEGCKTCGAFRALIDSQFGHEGEHECRITIDSASGFESLDLRVNATPFQIADMKVTFFHMTDISSEKRRKILERIFFHDVLNTTGNLINIVEVLDQEMEGDKAREFLSYLRIASKRLLDEIRAQREILAAENRELTPDFIPVDSFEFVQALAMQYSKHDVARGKQVLIAPDCSAERFTTDPILLGRVLGNMLKNALEASSPGAAVTIGCRLLPEHLQFWVQNEKPMSSDVQLQVFQRSFSTKGSARGVGTYSMRLLTERYLKGTVGFESSPEKGTIFFARYPKNPLAGTA